MIDSAKQRAIQADLQRAVASVLKTHGVCLKAPLDVRRARDGSFGRVMKFDFEPGVAKTTTGVKKPKLNKNASLATAMAAYGIKNKTNAKGDTLVSYHHNRPKYPFVYLSPNGHTRWKQTAEQARRRFG